MVGETGFEPATPWSRKAEEAFAPISIGSQNLQGLADTQEGSALVSYPIAETAPDPKYFATRLLPRSTGPDLRPTQLLSVREVARLLGLCRASIYRLVERGELPAIRIGNSIRFLQDELSDWLQGFRHFTQPRGCRRRL